MRMKKIIVLLIVLLCVCVFVSCTSKDDLCENQVTEYVRISESVKFMITDESADLHAIFTPRGTSFEVEWDSDNKAVAVVDEGRVTALSSGRAQISVNIVNTKHRAVCEIIVSDKEVSERYAGAEGGGRYASLDAAVADCEDGESILLFRGFHSCNVPVTKNIKLLGEQGAFIGGLTVEGAVVGLENLTFYTSDESNTGGLVLKSGSGAYVENCTFSYDVKEKVPGTDAYNREHGKNEEQGAKNTVAITADKDFSELSVSGCTFGGYSLALDIRPSDGEISVRDNTFTSCASAIRVDVRDKDTKNTALRGTIQNNVFSGMTEPTVFNFNGGVYMGALKFDDYKSN